MKPISTFEAYYITFESALPGSILLLRFFDDPDAFASELHVCAVVSRGPSALGTGSVSIVALADGQLRCFTLKRIPSTGRTQTALLVLGAP